ncbi:uncharacterized protein [Nicotiana sylvestris]|uniref:uncharacterized protein n=1 Tax=Nicotiana sylvestris TaxID=4096 RepID=UPI00388CBD42
MEYTLECSRCITQPKMHPRKSKVEDVVDENVNNEVRINIQEVKVETQNDVNPSREHIIDMPELSLSINVPLVKALEQMSGYAKFIKDLVTKMRSMDCETMKMTHQVSALVHSITLKLEDLGAFTIPCTIGSADFAKALCDLGASIDFNPSRFSKLWVDYEVPIILGRPFLATGKALADVEAGELTFRVGDEKVVFHVCKSMKHPNGTEV